jgi:hypothetical protein
MICLCGIVLSLIFPSLRIWSLISFLCSTLAQHTNRYAHSLGSALSLG